MDEQLRLTALAKLKNGTPPADLANEIDVTYARALKLKKQLHDAEEADDLETLFGMGTESINILTTSIAKQIVPHLDVFNAGELITEEAQELAGSADKLDGEFQAAASALAHKITSAAMVSNNADTVLALSDALCKLQTTFFGQGHHGNEGENLGETDFEKYLRN